MTAIVVRSIGDSAEHLLITAEKLSVSASCIASFQHCVYLEFSASQFKGILCVATRKLPRGPLTVTISADDLGRLKTAFEQGVEISACPGAALWLDRGRASVWYSTLMFDGSIALPDRRWLNALTTKAPAESLMFYSAGFSTTEQTSSRLFAAQQHYFSAALQSTSRLLEHVLSDTNTSAWLPIRGADPLIKLSGAGRGMTPAGDDALAGIFIALHVLDEHQVAARLRVHSGNEILARTHVVSGALLAEAMAGRADELIHEFVDNLSRSQLTSVQQSATLLSGMGQTSGWDCLAGMLLVINAVHHARNLSTSQAQQRTHA